MIVIVVIVIVVVVVVVVVGVWSLSLRQVTLTIVRCPRAEEAILHISHVLSKDMSQIIAFV